MEKGVHTEVITLKCMYIDLFVLLLTFYRKGALFSMFFMDIIG
ncbi:hypothetical protein JV16_02907 [Anoxybacillus ayderensis]|jgi:hypothetical protein|uniref:Uncharacterized protein n=1 Tax=Anoxybacillus ayderensis TaxID=265546 RepID=A0A0D0HIG9_9BACL|nr:hypothetical protein JV16_02907 [Anoxybacillus ayderensis]